MPLVEEGISSNAERGPSLAAQEILGLCATKAAPPALSIRKKRRRETEFRLQEKSLPSRLAINAVAVNSLLPLLSAMPSRDRHQASVRCVRRQSRVGNVLPDRLVASSHIFRAARPHCRIFRPNSEKSQAQDRLQRNPRPVS